MQPDRHCVSADEPRMNVLLDASCLTLVDRGTSFLHDNRYWTEWHLNRLCSQKVSWKSFYFHLTGKWHWLGKGWGGNGHGVEVWKDMIDINFLILEKQHCDFLTKKNLKHPLWGSADKKIPSTQNSCLLSDVLVSMLTSAYTTATPHKEIFDTAVLTFCWQYTVSQIPKMYSS